MHLHISETKKFKNHASIIQYDELNYGLQNVMWLCDYFFKCNPDIGKLIT